MRGPSQEAVTELLQSWRRGDAGARDRLFLLVYDELRRRAAEQLRRERRDHTLQPTALVHEAYLRLCGQGAAWNDRRHFFAFSSQVMRRVLVDHARARNAAKRPSAHTRVTLSPETRAPREVDLLALDQALDQLAAADERQARIVELRFFGGLTLEEVASVMELSLATVNREWRLARAWLYQRVQ